MRWAKQATWLALAVLCLCLTTGASSQLDGFEDDLEVEREEQGLHRGAARGVGKEDLQDFKFADSEAAPTGKRSFKSSGGPAGRGWLPAQEHYYVEFGFILFLAFYGVNLYFGRKENERIALQWAHVFCDEGSVIERNFASLKDEQEVVIRDSASVYKLYASGRRYCSGLMATLDLRARQDLCSLAWYLVAPRQDFVDIEVYMNDSNMPSTVLLIGAGKHCRAIKGEAEDIDTYTHKVAVSKIKDEVPNFPYDDLQVYAEANSVFFQLMKENLLSTVFTSNFESVAKCFRYLHFTSENAMGSHSKVLKFSFALPANGDDEGFARLISIIPHFIDAMGTMKLTPQALKQANERRMEMEKKKNAEAAAEHKEKLREKKAEKLEAEKARAYRAGPEAAAKWEAAQESKMRKKEQRKHIKSM